MVFHYPIVPTIGSLRKDHILFIFLYLCKISFENIYVSLFPNSLFFSTDLCAHCFASATQSHYSIHLVIIEINFFYFNYSSPYSYSCKFQNNFIFVDKNLTSIFTGSVLNTYNPLMKNSQYYVQSSRP